MGRREGGSGGQVSTWREAEELRGKPNPHHFSISAAASKEDAGVMKCSFVLYRL